MKKSIFKVLAIFCISLILLFSLSFIGTDTEYMVANSKGDYGKAGSEQKSEVQNTELKETGIVLSEGKDLEVKNNEATKLETNNISEKKPEAKISELLGQETIISEEKSETQSLEIVDEKTTILSEEQKVEKAEMTEQKAEASKTEQKAEKAEMTEQKAEVSKEEPKAEEPKMEEKKEEALKEEPKAEEPEMEEKKAEASKEEPKAEIFDEEKKVEEQKTEMKEDEILEEEQRMEAPEIEEPEVIEPDTSISEETEQEQLETEKAEEGAVEEKKIAKYEGDLTSIVSNDGRKLTIKYEGQHWLVSFAIFKCDTSMCVGFEGNDKSRVMAGRRGGCTVEMLAPEALEGYEFVKWEKTEKEVVGSYNSKVDVYTAVYKEIDNSKEISVLTTKKYIEKLDATKPKAEEKETIEKEVAESDVQEEEVTQPDVEQKAEEKKDTESGAHKHVKYEPEDGRWTEMTTDGKNITIKYKGCYCYVSFAKFICDTNMCKGFGNNGTSEMMEGRRGGCTVTVTAPEAKEGFEFKGWRLEKSEANIDVYRAVYEEIK